MKSLALIVLLQYASNDLGGLTLKELAERCPVSYEYLKARLGKWHKWKYITRHVATDGHRPVYRYSIAERGETFVTLRIPPSVRAEYITELKEFNRVKTERFKAQLAARIAALKRERQ